MAKWRRHLSGKPDCYECFKDKCVMDTQAACILLFPYRSALLEPPCGKGGAYGALSVGESLLSARPVNRH